MILKLEEAKELFSKAVYHKFIKYDCPHCNETLIVDPHDCFELVLFEPYEEEEESTVFAALNEKTGKYEYVPNGEVRKKKKLVSSDPNKDILKFICPVCGKEFEITLEELRKLTYCALDGEEHRIFVLSKDITDENW